MIWRIIMMNHEGSWAIMRRHDASWWSSHHDAHDEIEIKKNRWKFFLKNLSSWWSPSWWQMMTNDDLFNQKSSWCDIHFLLSSWWNVSKLLSSWWNIFKFISSWWHILNSIHHDGINVKYFITMTTILKHFITKNHNDIIFTVVYLIFPPHSIKMEVQTFLEATEPKSW